MINSSKQVSINCKTKIHKTFATVLAVILSLTLSCTTSTCFANSINSLSKESTITNSTFTVTYDGNGSPTATVSGTVPIDGNFYTSGSSVTVLPPTSLALTIVGTATTNSKATTGGTKDKSYPFTTWTTRSKSNGLETSYSPGDSISITENITLYAQYAYPTVDEKVFTNNTLGGGTLIATNNNAPAGQRQLLIMANEDYLNGTTVDWGSEIGHTITGAGYGYGFYKALPSIGFGQNNIMAMANYINPHPSYFSRDYPIFSKATLAIAESNVFPAAAAAAKCTYGGYQDWYLPSIGELNQIFKYINILKNTNILNNNGNKLIYWSSTEDADFKDCAWFQNFDGSQDIDLKILPHSVRAVRTIKY